MNLESCFQNPERVPSRTKIYLAAQVKLSARNDTWHSLLEINPTWNLELTAILLFPPTQFLAHTITTQEKPHKLSRQRNEANSAKRKSHNIPLTDKMANTSSSTKRSPKAATAAAVALSAMIALNVCPVQAFQPTFLAPSARMMHRSPAFSSPVVAPPAAVKMDCTPWDLECYGVHPLQRNRLMQQRRPGSVFFAPSDVFQDSSLESPQQLVISDPTVVQDSADLYTLAFDLPEDVDQDGLEVSVSGRLLTVKARMTREESASPSAGRGGWVTRSSRTDSVSRSFVLPEGLSASSATASLLPNGKAEVRYMFLCCV